MPVRARTLAPVNHERKTDGVLLLGENNLSFIETSALDASNVELAFQNILTGTLNTRYLDSRYFSHKYGRNFKCKPTFQSIKLVVLFALRVLTGALNFHGQDALTSVTEIYRIVSSKALDQGEGSQNVLGSGPGQKLDLSTSEPTGEKKGGCC